MSMRKSSFLVIMVLMVTSCVGSNLTRAGIGSILINGLVVTNTTEEHVYNFLLMVEKVKEMVSVSPILAKASFTTNFPLRKYKGNRISVTWTHRGRNWESGSLIVKPTKDLVAGRPVAVEIVLGEHGHVSTGMIQTGN
jgi:hypothetical protein